MALMTVANTEITPGQLTEYCNASQYRWKRVEARCSNDLMAEHQHVSLRGVTVDDKTYTVSAQIDVNPFAERIRLVEAFARAVASAIKELNLAALPAAARYIKA